MLFLDQKSITTTADIMAVQSVFNFIRKGFTRVLRIPGNLEFSWYFILSQEISRILLPKKISGRNIKNSLRYTQKTLKIIDFLYTTPPMMVTWQAPRADKASKIVLKVVQEDFGNTSKKSSWLHLPFFFHEFFFG